MRLACLDQLSAKRAQSDIIGFLLIIALAIVIVSLTYFWAGPMLQRAQDEQAVQELREQMYGFCSAIKAVANEQGAISIQFKIPKGYLALSQTNDTSTTPNTIVYKGVFSLANPPPRKLLIGYGVSQSDLASKTPADINMVRWPGAVPLGEEPCFLIEQGSTEFYLHFRHLSVSNGTWTECYRIRLVAGEQAAAGAGQRTINLVWKGENVTTNVGSCNRLTEQIVEFSIK